MALNDETVNGTAGEENGSSRHLVVLRQNAQDSDTSEAYKTLRTNISFSGENIKVLCITSAMPNDGKSTVSYNLARAFAENGSKTLLIDADLRKSVMRKKICKAGDPGFGLTYYLVGLKDFDDSVCATNLHDLDVIFAGQFPPNPSELLGSSRFAEFIGICRERYSKVIIDTPPIGRVIDAAIAAKVCDGSVLVLKCNSISYKLARICKNQLEVSGKPILGCVLNEVDMASKKYYGSYRYYGQYGKY